MTILPLRVISQTEKSTLGINLLNLAALKRLDFPIPDGLVVTIPESFKQIISSNFESLENSEKSINIIKKEIYSQSIPKTLIKELPLRMRFLINKQLVEGVYEVWRLLLDNWMEELNKIIKNQEKINIKTNFNPQLILFIPKNNFLNSKKYAIVKASFKSNQENIKIESKEKLPQELEKQIYKIVLKAQDHLRLPHTYQFLISSKSDIYLTFIHPSIFELPQTLKTENPSVPKNSNPHFKSAMKIFKDLSSNHTFKEELDGIFLRNESLDLEEFMKKVIHLNSVYPTEPIIYSLPDHYLSNLVIEESVPTGVLTLLNQKNLLKNILESILFLRNKKGILNLNISIPKVSSEGELTQIKRELSSEGLVRKSGFLVWLEVSTPENVINIDKYIKVGIDGVILKIDDLYNLILGGNYQETRHLKKQGETLFKFIKPLIETLQKNNIPVLVQGDITLTPDYLDYFTSAGIFGVITSTGLETDNLSQHLNQLENRMFAKRFWLN